MNKVNFFLVISILLVPSLANARTLNGWIESFVDYEEGEENKSENGFSYLLQNKKIIQADFNNDSKKDAIVVLDYCEEVNCHPTTTYSKIHPLINIGNGQYTSLPNIETQGFANVTFVKGKLIVKTTEYGDNDPSCCASLQKTRRYAYVNKNGFGYSFFRIK